MLVSCKSESSTESPTHKYSSDLKPLSVQSTPFKIYIPEGLSLHFNIRYLGAFRANARGESSSSYAVGVLAYNEMNNSLFLAGHAHHNAVAEFGVPEKLSFEEKPADIVSAEVLQSYVKLLNKKQVGNQTDKITGMLVVDNSLLVSSEIWYDGGGTNKDNLQVFDDASALSSSPYKGMLQLNGAAKSGGYMSLIPKRWQQKFGGEYLAGWASNYSITSRYSQGPSIYVFDPQNALNADINIDRRIQAVPKMVFPLQKGKELVAGGSSYQTEVSPVWGALSKARYGFIVPDSDYFLAVGSHGGIHDGIGYKITQDNGRKCGGGCTKNAKDVYNYYWLFNVDDIINAKAPHQIKPVAYGKWSHPYDNKGTRQMIGASFDNKNNRLFLSIANAARTEKYDRPPLIIAYEIMAK